MSCDVRQERAGTSEIRDLHGDQIASIGLVLTFDFCSLPPGWEASTNFAATTGGLSRAEYWQQIFVTSPDGVKLAVNITISMTSATRRSMFVAAESTF